MKRSHTTAVGLMGAAALLFAAAPSQAAMGQWSIKGPGAIGGATVSRSAFGLAKCDTNSPAVQNTQGQDGVAINVAGYRSRTLHFSWSSTAPKNVGGLGGSFMTGACTMTGSTTSLPSSATPGNWDVVVPGDATWFLVDANGAVLVTLTLNSVS